MDRMKGIVRMAKSQTFDFEVQNLSCASCVGRAQKALESVPGVEHATVNLANHTAHVEGDADAAARGVLDGLFGLVGEEVVLQAVTGRSQRGEMGAGARATHPSDRRTWPRSTRRTMEGGIAWMWRNVEGSACVCVCVCERLRKGSAGQARNVCSERNVFAF